MQIEENISLDFDDVLIKPKRSILTSRSEVNVTRSFTFKNSRKNWTGVPLIAANMDVTGTFEIQKVLSEYGMLTAFHKHYSTNDLENFIKNNTSNKDRYFVSIGMREEDYAKFLSLEMNQETEGTMLCVDVPSAYLEKFIDFIKLVRDQNPDTTIMAGNVCTGEMTEALILAGVDIVKVGVGPGSGCLTRRVAGVGVPQLTAIIDCADAAHGLKGHICADGGIVHPGDLGKAFGGGADFIMMGGILSGHKECGGEVYNSDGKLAEGDLPDDARPSWRTKFYGMASHEAMNKYYGGRAKYRAAEGRIVEVPYKGTVKNTVEEFLGGLRSTMSYIGAEHLKEISKRTTFVRVNKILNTSLGK